MLWPFRTRRTARRAADPQDDQVAEQAAARQRILDLARCADARDMHRRPGWNAPMRPLPVTDRPLLTPGQAARGHGGRR